MREKKKERKQEIEKKIREIREQREKLKGRKKHIIRLLDKIVYWFWLIMAIIGNLVIAISFIPFLLSFDKAVVYVIVVILGLAFGLFFEIVVRGIEHMQKKTHIIITILIPLMALISFFIITVVVNNIKLMFGIKTINHEPFLVGTAYAVAFILPYVIYQLILKKKVKGRSPGHSH